MNPRLPRPTGAELVVALGRAGFAVLRVRGSHHFLRHADGRSTVVPVHAGETIGPGLLGKIRSARVQCRVFARPDEVCYPSQRREPVTPNSPTGPRF